VPRRALQSAAQSGRFAAEGWRIRKDGTKFWASIRIDPIREDGELLGFAKVTRDVSQHRESNLAMENLLERLTLAADSAGIGIWDWDIREDVLIWDDWMFRLYGSSGPTRSITMNYGSGICTPTTAPPPRAPWRTAWSVPSRWTASSALFGTTAASTKSAAPAA